MILEGLGGLTGICWVFWGLVGYVPDSLVVIGLGLETGTGMRAGKGRDGFEGKKVRRLCSN